MIVCTFMKTFIGVFICCFPMKNKKTKQKNQNKTKTKTKKNKKLNIYD